MLKVLLLTRDDVNPMAGSKANYPQGREAFKLEPNAEWCTADLVVFEGRILKGTPGAAIEVASLITRK
jgi:hypothetical protein